MAGVRIGDLVLGDDAAIEQAARLLVEGLPQGWPDLPSALEEVRESCSPDHISRLAILDDGSIAGWIGGRSDYGGNVWEIHPLVVRRDCRRRGIGRALVADLEAHAAAHGAHTLLLGADDEAGLTSIGGRDLYPDVLKQLSSIRNLAGHPFGFYQRLGFALVGVIPDANGLGKPDILMAKRVQR